MTYRVSYDHGPGEQRDVKRTEFYRTELEALNRARELLDGGEHQSIIVHDGSGRVLTGIRLQLKLGMLVTG